jgi:hypothetical protein
MENCKETDNLLEVALGMRHLSDQIAYESYKHLQVVQKCGRIDIIPAAHLTDEKINAVYTLVHSE